LKLVTFEEVDGKATFWHSSAISWENVWKETLEFIYVMVLRLKVDSSMMLILDKK